MRDTTDTPRVDPKAVGQDRPTEPRSGRAAGSWFKVGAVTWIVPILLALLFVAAIVAAVLMQGQ